MRYNLRTSESFLCVSVQLPNYSQPSWFGLWIKKTQQTLTMDKQNSTGNYLVPIPSSSSYIPCVPGLSVTVGSEFYSIGGSHTPLHFMWVRKNPNDILCQAPSMTMPRAQAMNAHAVVLDEKIYVMGGCKKDDESAKNWGEVYDTKTQTWESFPYPGEKLGFSLIKKVWRCDGKLFVIIIEEKETRKYFYYPKEGKWERIETPFLSLIRSWKDKMVYFCDHNRCVWFDSKIGKRGMVKGLDLLKGYNMVEIINHGGKFVVFSEDKLGQSDENKRIWCAMVALEIRDGGEIWGQIEWNDIVRIVPQSSMFLNCVGACF